MAHNIVVNEEKGQFEISLPEGIALIGYELDSNVISIMHTEVPQEDEGQGIGTELAKFAFDYARQNDMKVKVYCRFVKAFLRHHPEYQEIVIS